MKDKKYYIRIITESKIEECKIEYDVSFFNENLKDGICGLITSNEEFKELRNKYGISSICRKVVDVIRSLYGVDLGDVSFSVDKTRRTIITATKRVRKKIV